MKKLIIEYFQNLVEIIGNLDYGQIDKFISILWKAANEGRTIYFIGNGGSAATATHFAADLGKNTVTKSEKIRFKTMALVDNVAWVTALGNDLGFEEIFVEQLKNFSKRGDVLVAISASGNSANIVNALRWAKMNGLRTCGLLGFDGGKAKSMVDLAVMVKVDHYGLVEGVHGEIQHLVIEMIKKLAEDKKHA